MATNKSLQIKELKSPDKNPPKTPACHTPVKKININTQSNPINSIANIADEIKVDIPMNDNIINTPKLLLSNISPESHSSSSDSESEFAANATRSINGSSKNPRKSVTVLSLHTSKFSFNWSEISNEFSEKTNWLLIMLAFILLYIVYCLPHLLFDLSKSYGVILQNIIIIPGCLSFPFFVVRATLRIDVKPCPNIFYTNIIFLVIVNVFELILMHTGYSPLPFRVVSYSLLWFLIVPYSTYYFHFKQINDINGNDYMYAYLVALFFPILFYICMAFVFVFYFFKFSKRYNETSSSILQLMSIMLFSLLCNILKMYVPSLITFVQEKARVDNNTKSEYDGIVLARFITPVTLLFACDWVQEVYELVVLPESVGISSVIFLITMDCLSIFYKAIVVFPSIRSRWNNKLDTFKEKLPDWLYKKLKACAPDKTGTYKQSLEFGMTILVLPLANICGMIVITTLYFSRNKSMFTISDSSIQDLYYTTYVAGITTTVVCAVVAVIMHIYCWKVLRLCHPFYYSTLYIKHNLVYIIMCIATGLTFGLSVLGTHWNAITYMVAWLRS